MGDLFQEKEMFICDKCGLCCMHIDESTINENLNRGDGVCRYFDEKTLLCKIYSGRPIFCNVDKFYDEYLSLQCSRDEFYSANYELCKIFKERYGN